MSDVVAAHGDADAAWIDRTETLKSVVEAFRDAPRLAVDTEANGFHAYRPRLCLVQICRETSAGQSSVALIDAVALEGRLGPLAALLETGERQLIMHGADYDVRLLKRDARVSVTGLYDTQIAARFAGRKRTGLASLAEEIAGETLDKRAQRTDWRKRPLLPRELAYAAADARVLFSIRDVIAEELEALGRAAWAEEEFRALETVLPASETEPDEMTLLERASGAGALSPRERAVLARLLSWREAEARRRDIPAAFIVPPKILPVLARERPRSGGELTSVGVPARLAERYGRKLLQAMTEGEQADPIPRRKGNVRDRAPSQKLVAERLERLKLLRRTIAAELELEAGLVCPNSVLRAIAERKPADADGLREAGMKRWQVSLFGDRALSVLT